MATHFSIPAWRMPRAEEPGGLQSLGLQLKRLSACAQETEREGQVNPGFLWKHHCMKGFAVATVGMLLADL